MPPSPPAQEKKEISLIGQISGASIFLLSCSAAAVAKFVKRVTNSELKIAMSSDHPECHRPQITCMPVSHAASLIVCAVEKSKRFGCDSIKCQRRPSRTEKI